MWGLDSSCSRGPPVCTTVEAVTRRARRNWLCLGAPDLSYLVGVRESFTREFLIVICVGVSAFIAGLGHRELHNPVEPRYAGMAMDIAQGGPAVVPLNGGEHYDQKPPLGLWASALFLKFGGATPSEFLVRLPGALMGILAAVGILLLGRLLFGGRAGLLGAVMFQTMWIIYWSGRFYHLDIPLTATVVWTMYAWARLSKVEGAISWRWAVLAFLSLAIGVFIKGPPAVVLPVGALLVHRLVSRNGAFRMQWLLPLAALSVVPAAIWFLLATQVVDDGGEWANELLVKQGLLRLASESYGGKHGFWYYPLVFWGIAAPWAFFLPAAIGCLLREKGQLRQGFTFCATWFLVIFVILMCGKSRRSRYLMPALPAIALILGAGLDLLLAQLADKKHRRNWLTWNVRLVFGFAGIAIFAAGYVLFLSAVGRSPFGSEAVQGVLEASIGLRWWALAFASIGVVLLFQVFGGRCRAAFWSLTSAICILILTWAFSCAVSVDRFKGYGELREVLAHELAQGAGFYIAGTYAGRESTSGYYRFYMGQTAQAAGVDGGLLQQRLKDGLYTVVLVMATELARNPGTIPVGYEAHPRGPFVREKILIYTSPLAR